MKIFLLSLLVSIFFLTNLYSQKDSVNVGPGVTYYSERRASGPYEFDVLVIDLTNPFIKLKSVKAGDKLRGFETTSSMAYRNHFEGHQVVGAINADFYNTSTGEPISTQISNGEIVNYINNSLAIAWNEAKKTFIGGFTASGSIVKGDSTFSINGFNSTRSENSMILYNSFMGTNTGTNQYGTEVIITPLSGWETNDTITAVVGTKSSSGNMSITTGKAVLSGHGLASSFITSNLNTGDTIKIIVNTNPALSGVSQLVGGHPVVVKNGVPQGNNVDKHPRTCIGINQDSTKLFFITVDGRQTGYSIGLTELELGQYMKEWGVYQGLNLDGGGSTTMVVRGKIMNSPSDGTERRVSNSLLLVSTAPTGPLHHVRISPRIVYVTTGSTAQYSVSGFDEFYNPVSLTSSTIQWSCTPASGTISSTGLFTASADTAAGTVYVNVDGFLDSVIVRKSHVASITLTPDPIILQPGQQQQMKAVAKDNYNNIIPLGSTDYTWSVTGGVGNINASGFFTATTNGTGSIEAKYKDVTGSVSVQVGNATFFVVDDFTTVEYTIRSTAATGCTFNIDQNIFVSPPSSGRLNYTLSKLGTSAVYLDKEMPISGTPEKVSISVYGDGKGQWLRAQFKDALGKRFLLNFTEQNPGVDWINEWRFVEQPFSAAVPHWSDGATTITFPVTWQWLYIVQPDTSKKGTGVIYFDDFKVHFVQVPVELISFSALVSGNDISLNWSTATETNNMGFEIQRSSDKANWNQIGYVKGHGTTSDPKDYYFSDKNMSEGMYFYRLKQIDLDGTFKYSKIIEAGLNPLDFDLQQNYPNPFNPSTVIKYSIPSQNLVTVKVYNILGKEVAVLVNEIKPAGNHEITFNAASLSAGVYFYSLNSAGFNKTYKMVLLK